MQGCRCADHPATGFSRDVAHCRQPIFARVGYLASVPAAVISASRERSHSLIKRLFSSGVTGIASVLSTILSKPLRISSAFLFTLYTCPKAEANFLSCSKFQRGQHSISSQLAICLAGQARISSRHLDFSAFGPAHISWLGPAPFAVDQGRTASRIDCPLALPRPVSAKTQELQQQ